MIFEHSELIRDIVLNARKSELRFQKQLDNVSAYMSRNKVAPAVQDRVKMWLNYTWSQQKSFDETEARRVYERPTSVQFLNTFISATWLLSSVHSAEVYRHLCKIRHFGTGYSVLLKLRDSIQSCKKFHNPLKVELGLGRVKEQSYRISDLPTDVLYLRLALPRAFLRFWWTLI